MRLWEKTVTREQWQQEYEAGEIRDVDYETMSGLPVDPLYAPKDSDPGKLNHVVGAVSGWVWMAANIAAHTRKGRMPTMWKSWAMRMGATGRTSSSAK